jgi:hypothetical protein
MDRSIDSLYDERKIQEKCTFYYERQVCERSRDEEVDNTNYQNSLNENNQVTVEIIYYKENHRVKQV